MIFYGLSNNFFNFSYIIDILGQDIQGTTYIIPGLDFIKLIGIFEDKTGTKLSYRLSKQDSKGSNKLILSINHKSQETKTNSLLLGNLNNLDNYFNYGVILPTNTHDNITINLISLFKDGNSLLSFYVYNYYRTQWHFSLFKLGK